MDNAQYTILVVDDDEAIREYVEIILKDEGYTVLTAENGKLAMVVVEKYKPKVLITDLIMPEKEGIETMRDIKTKVPNCGIIAMSGAVNSQTYLAMAEYLGAHKLVYKPFTREQMLTAVSSTIAMANL